MLQESLIHGLLFRHCARIAQTSHRHRQYPSPHSLGDDLVRYGYQQQGLRSRVSVNVLSLVIDPELLSHFPCYGCLWCMPVHVPTLSPSSLLTTG